MCSSHTTNIPSVTAPLIIRWFLNRLIPFLSLLLNNEKPVEERQRLIEAEYHIAMTDDIVENVITMCNFSEAIEMKGILKGRQEGRLEGRLEGFQLFGALISRLLELGRTEDASRAARDPAYRDELIAEFHLA